MNIVPNFILAAIYPTPMNIVPNFILGSGLSFCVTYTIYVICIFINTGENLKSNVKSLGKKENLRDLLIKLSHILAAIDPRPIIMVSNFSLGTGL